MNVCHESKNLARRVTTRAAFRRAWQAVREDRGRKNSMFGHGPGLVVAWAAYWDRQDSRTLREILAEKRWDFSDEETIRAGMAIHMAEKRRKAAAK